MNRLAIVIPAYKIEHLGKVFQCIKNQTCQDFSLYVFDDASPYDIKGCFDVFFKESETVHFYRFPDNLGSINLSRHWNRCVELAGDEEWVWNFSDDDVMSPDCVEEFYKHVDDADVHDVMRFILNGTNNSNQVVPFRNPTVRVLSCVDFFSQNYMGIIDARMQEFVFRRNKLREIGGYVPYDLAWRSDNATVMKMAYPYGIFNLPKGEVLWRKGTENVSGRTDYNKRKNEVTIEFFNWVDVFFTEHNLSYTISEDNLLKVYAWSLLLENKMNLDERVQEISSRLVFINSTQRQQLFLKEAKRSLKRHLSVRRQKQFFCFLKKHAPSAVAILLVIIALIWLL